VRERQVGPKKEEPRQGSHVLSVWICQLRKKSLLAEIKSVQTDKGAKKITNVLFGHIYFPEWIMDYVLIYVCLQAEQFVIKRSF
jgi:hypothetical protein